MYQYDIQLLGLGSGRAITHGGAFYVVSNGTPSRVKIYDNTDTIKNNPASINSGMVSFRTEETVNSVDVFGMTDKGYAFQIIGLTPGSMSSFRIDLNRMNQTIMIPFDIASAPAAVLPALTANAEFFTGFKLASRQSLQPIGAGVLVTTLDAGMTVDVGTDSNTGTNDPDGFFDNLSLAALGMTQALVGYAIGTNSVLVDVTGGTQEWTFGELYHPANTKSASKAEGTDSATTKNGLYLMKDHTAGINGGTTAEEITFTLSASTDTAAGFIVLPARINQLPY